MAILGQANIGLSYAVGTATATTITALVGLTPPAPEFKLVETSHLGLAAGNAKTFIPESLYEGGKWSANIQFDSTQYEALLSLRGTAANYFVALSSSTITAPSVCTKISVPEVKGTGVVEFSMDFDITGNVTVS